MTALLRPGAPFVFSILHPCFPGWGPVPPSWPPDGGYGREGYWQAPGVEGDVREQVGSNHRMLSTYVNAAGRHGLVVESMAEPPPPWPLADQPPPPMFLAVRCRRA